MNEPGIFISDSEFNHLMTIRKAGKFNPDREFIRKEVDKYLKRGGRITNLNLNLPNVTIEDVKQYIIGFEDD